MTTTAIHTDAITQNHNCAESQPVVESMAWSHGRPDKATALLLLLAAGAVIEDDEQEVTS